MNKNAGMVYAKDFAQHKNETEQTFNYPLEIKLDRLGQFFWLHFKLMW